MEQMILRDPVQKKFLTGMALLLSTFLLLLSLGDWGPQTDLFYLRGRDFLADACNTEEYARALDPYGYGEGALHVPFKDGNYPPLAYVLFYLMDGLSGRDMSTFRAKAVAVGCMALSALLLFFCLYRLMEGRAPLRLFCALALTASVPVAYAFERGNIILLTAGLCAFFLCRYDSEKKWLRELAFLALAAAAALKIYPALLGLLLLPERRYREAARLVAYGAAFALLPFLLLRGGFSNIPYLLENLGAHVAFYDRFIYPRFGFRLFSSICYDTHWTNAFLENNLWRLGEKMAAVLPALDAIVSALCLCGALLTRARWKRLLCIMLVIVNYPVNSGAYAGLYLLPVMALYLSEEALPGRARWDLVAFFLLLCPVQIPIPYAALGIVDPIMVNLTDILRALTAYALFWLCGVESAILLVRRLPGLMRRTHPTSAQS